MNFTFNEIWLSVIGIVVSTFIAPLMSAYVRENGVQKVLNKIINITMFLCIFDIVFCGRCS